MLTITPISFSGIRNLPKSSFNNATLPKLGQDTFTKSNNISFRGENPFIDWMMKNDITPFDIQRAMCEENLLGSGNFSTAYAIPNCEDYILKINNYDLDEIQQADFSKAQIKNSIDKDLQINIGQKVATIEIRREFPIPLTVEVLKKQSGESIGVQPPETLVNEHGELKNGCKSYEDYSRKEKYGRTIHQVAQLPIEAYEDLLNTYMQADKTGYKFDHLNSNNLLIDDGNQKINLIDMEKYGISDNLSGLLYALTNIQYYRTYVDSYPNPVPEEKRQLALQDTITIIQKFCTAMKKQGLKFDRNNIPYEAAKDLYSSYPCWLALNARNEVDAWNKLSQMGLVK